MQRTTKKASPVKAPNPARHTERPATNRLLYIANWKMNLDHASSARLASAYANVDVPDGVDVVVCPSHTALAEVRRLLRNSTVMLGAQDVSMSGPGAHTGDVSANDIRSIGCRYAIVGHSERRREHGETDEDIGRKTLAALAHHLSPIVCVGEAQQDRASHRHVFVVMRQLQQVLRNLPPPRASQEVVVAYEPVWAISPGGPASPEDAREMASVIRQSLVDHYGERLTDRHCRIVYGGSVDPGNVGSFVDGELIHGVLVGRESISAHEFRGVLNGLAHH